MAVVPAVAALAALAAVLAVALAVAVAGVAVAAAVAAVAVSVAAAAAVERVLVVAVAVAVSGCGCGGGGGFGRFSHVCGLVHEYDRKHPGTPAAHPCLPRGVRGRFSGVLIAFCDVLVLSSFRLVNEWFCLLDQKF